jgi:hypothetical protein
MNMEKFRADNLLTSSDNGKGFSVVSKNFSKMPQEKRAFFSRLPPFKTGFGRQGDFDETAVSLPRGVRGGFGEIALTERRRKAQEAPNPSRGIKCIPDVTRGRPFSPSFLFLFPLYLSLSSRGEKGMGEMGEMGAMGEKEETDLTRLRRTADFQVCFEAHA